MLELLAKIMSQTKSFRAADESPEKRPSTERDKDIFWIDGVIVVREKVLLYWLEPRGNYLPAKLEACEGSKMGSAVTYSRCS